MTHISFTTYYIDPKGQSSEAHGKKWPHPVCTLVYSDTIEEDKDNGVMLRVRRYIELNTNTWSMRLLKTAECLRKVPRFTWARFYAK
ncbi:hypothetical protein ANCCAN_01050 [Ancylostoma caninum]|uniref:Uncharacterized protein n=1 Tax=Ancylostoma caninum TaxID=29170 RepID=A0A368H7Y1_ANCCA|nr:hypothetical protein ANCCAN_01050 [Ancylostoma caninum]